MLNVVRTAALSAFQKYTTRSDFLNLVNNISFSKLVHHKWPGNFTSTWARMTITLPIMRNKSKFQLIFVPCLYIAIFW